VANLWLDILINLGPLLVFVALMVIVYFRGVKTNKKLLADIEGITTTALKSRGYAVERVKIRPDEYEYRCKSKNKRIKILTLNLKLANRTFIIQWLIGKIFKDKDKLFIGSKFAGGLGNEDPSYSFDIVPYRRGKYISQRFDHFIKYEDIATVQPIADEEFMIKSETHTFVSHYVDNEEFVSLMLKTEPYMEHLNLSRAKEGTDPHLSVTYQFQGTADPPVKEFVNLFFLAIKLHLENNGRVKKLRAKGGRGKGKSGKRGTSRDFKQRMQKKKSKGKK
jgi:hypothetical protein